MANVDIDLGKYSLGWSDTEKNVFKPEKGLNEEIIRKMSEIKEEPEWMLDFRLKAYKRFLDKPMPEWVAKEKLKQLDFDDIYYYIKPTENQTDSWDEVPEEIKETYEKLGIPEAERTYLAGVTAQYESEVVYHKNREDLEKLGVLFCDMDTAVREYPELVKEYFGTVIPPGDNKFAALNSAVWSGGSFIYVPKGVHVEDPLQAYFRINAENMGQFERTLILVDEGASVHYIEGCSAPVY
ncbi:MAG: Fe-S cluster assembly protein SufB, partial [Actinobacteria bacterium]|nr:Fe-S cluster assembly protein SufB [Actinomycetota bacterium]